MTTKDKKPNKARINYYVDILIGISFIVVALSGVILLFAGSGGYQGGRNPHAQEVLGVSRLLWKDLHDWSGIAMMGGVLLHLVLHWKWIVCMTRNIFKGNANKRVKPVRTVTADSCPL